MKHEQQVRSAGTPQLLNLNEDPLFDRKVVHDLKAHPNYTVGRRNKQDPSKDPNIALTTVGV